MVEVEFPQASGLKVGQRICRDQFERLRRQLSESEPTRIPLVRNVLTGLRRQQ
jgi:hypothetical protein